MSFGWFSKLIGSGKDKGKGTEEVQPSQPGLRPLASAVAAFKQGGYNDDAEAFKDFVICQYELNEYEAALGEEEAALCKSMTEGAYLQHAQDCLEKASEEISKEEDDLDLKSMFDDEIGQWKKRVRERREAEKKEQKKRIHERRTKR